MLPGPPARADRRRTHALRSAAPVSPIRPETVTEDVDVSRFVPLALLGLVACSADSVGDRAPASAPTYVGRATCEGCHEPEGRAWRGSHHDLAMQVASDSTVLGDFRGTSFVHAGVTTTFLRSPAGFHVETEGPDGGTHRYDVAYTFGVEPLQQYLIEWPGGRLQALSVVWDTRPESDGGQRWYRLYPEEEIGPGDALHWTGPGQNWNRMCAECHSTGLAKGYDVTTDTYRTTWAEIDVSCEACHGPGSAHEAWARAVAGRDGDPGSRETRAGAGGGRYGLTVELGDQGGGAWIMDEARGIATRTAPPVSDQIDVCGRCHARRAPLDPEAPPGGELMDTHLPQVLARDLYYADGQILDEVYVWGSFVQSAMHRAGVRCSDCHEPHGLGLRAPGNGVCAACHLPSRFDVPEHHRHALGGPAARCVSCHMPATTYMGVDARRDHSLRVPRPDVSAAVGSPDACTSCHTNRSTAWAADAIVAWYGRDRRREPRYGPAIHAGREGAPGAGDSLATLARDPATPAVVRATAVGLMAERPSPAFGAVLPPALDDPDPLVRATAVRTLDVVQVERRLALAGPLLNDPVLAVRTQAARVLAPLHREGLAPGQVRILERATEEYRRVLDATGDDPSSHVALARLEADLGRPGEAEEALETALRIGPWYVPAWVNMADLYRSLGREAEGEALLRRGLERHPQQPALHYALGLLLTRTGRGDSALVALERAARLGRDDARYAFALGVALNGAGRVDEAVVVLDTILERHPHDRDVLYALATIHRDAGRLREALRFARRLVALEPDRPAFAALVEALESR